VPSPSPAAPVSNEARSRATIGAAVARSAAAGQTAAGRAVAAKSARHAEAFFCRWAQVNWPVVVLLFVLYARGS
jgi:hypothetical protein